MPTRPLSDELAQEAADALKKHGRKYLAAKALNLDQSTFDHRLKMAAMRGMMAGDFVVPDGHVIKGISALVNRAGETVQQWIKTKEGELDPKVIVEWLKDAFKDYKPAAPKAIAPKVVNSDLLTVIPCNDWHLGMFGWGQEVGENWDLKIAEDAIGNAIEDTISRSPPSDHAVLLGGGDLLHADNKNNQTAHSGNQLDVDGRYPKVLEAACRIMVRAADAALLHHKSVIIRILPGNHDEHSAVAVAYFLKAWYRKEPRITVDTDPSLFWWHRFGQCLFGSTHGHTVKIANMPGIMAHRRAGDWGATKFRYVHGFHLHHSAKTATEGNGVLCEIHQAPIPQDAWHYGSGFLSGRSMQAITYHRDFGEVGRVRVVMLDAELGGTTCENRNRPARATAGSRARSSTSRATPTRKTSGKNRSTAAARKVNDRKAI